MNDVRPILSKPPLNILVNPGAIKNRRIWEIDLKDLLDKLLKVLADVESLDIRICASAALTSAIIYRLKVETLFLFEKLKVERRPATTIEPPQILLMPFRYELASTTIEDLLKALEKILSEILSQGDKKEKPEAELTDYEPLIKVDSFIAYIQERLASFKDDLLNTLNKVNEILFSEYIQGFALNEAMRIFILLLFLANEGVIRLEQFEDDIKILKVDNYDNRG
ncbi:MAG: hypothetical protein RMJ31_03770 [Nitrososphaerota archaeon]|nr:hypothetical protein [Nitrososphaerales archaeon]MDW8044875.1 hypothetical protein [Nitrososphaerota archaeon]